MNEQRAGPLGPDARIAELAGRQHGIVARRQLRALDLSDRIIDGRRARGVLIGLHRGVYAVGHRPRAREAWWLAAVLAAGPDAVLSGRSAAALWHLRHGDGARCEVTKASGVVRPGIHARCVALPGDERTVHDGIPVTTPMRTVLDLSAITDRRGLEKAMREAEYLRLYDGFALVRLLKRHPRRRGTRTLRAIVAETDLGRDRTRSVMEERFLAFLDAHGLPAPEVNEELDVGRAQPEVDCHWPDQRLVVELDSRAAHATRTAFEADRTRDRRLLAAGWRVVRITWRELHLRPGEVAADLRGLLAARPREPG